MSLPRQLRGSMGVGLGFDFREKDSQGPKGEFGGSLIQSQKEPRRSEANLENNLVCNESALRAQ